MDLPLGLEISTQGGIISGARTVRVGQPNAPVSISINGTVREITSFYGYATSFYVGLNGRIEATSGANNGNGDGVATGGYAGGGSHGGIGKQPLKNFFFFLFFKVTFGYFLKKKKKLSTQNVNAVNFHFWGDPVIIVMCYTSLSLTLWSGIHAYVM